MAEDRRPYRRESQEQRRDALITAALELMAEGGPQAATVRAIAARAGITAGLIRHYFQSKDDLTRAAYATLMERMTAESLAATDNASDDPAARLAAFVAASLRPPVMDGERVRLWAGFLHHVRRDPAMHAVHEATYLNFRDRLQALIQALPGKDDPARARALSIACNAVIDGLWLEGGMLTDSFAAGEMERIGLSAIAAILDVPMPSPPPNPVEVL
ncbi:MAG: TetR family transcriptional regulator C-terminal domain-containing protein [Pseudotabrizicola sp.]|uniref:TetR/AcrR family transcriptional regulator n=1 Tax=Pseudotabrizicola sp. TaxID=2939647 RepID=UPI002723BF3F|nr:TetR family transcriptional regulator C-terminal domain-containing protein [Pseudotabrizicola sp.]MDO9640246.1 TetR family transcriptional regulator C-terminal domain-containing protein [Pseudotabrizicola sp.]